MIRFLQTPGPIKKFVLGGLLTIISALMAITLIPGFGSANFLGNGTSTKGVVATVSGEEIHTSDVQKQARQTLEQEYPRAGAQASMLLPYLSQQAYQMLVARKLLVTEARNMGLRATDDDLRNFLHQGQIGQMIFPNGKYDQTAYEDVAFRNGFTVPQFEEVLKQDILIQKLRDLVSASASVTDAEVKAQFAKQNTKVKFDYAFFKRDDILKTLQPADAELKAYYDRNKTAYVNSLPEKRQLKYVVIDNSKLLAETQVSQQELEGYYEQHRDQYRVPEQVHVHQIVVNKPLAGADGKVDQQAVDQARAKADDVLKQLKSGKDFADLAKKYSDDAATAKNGGSQGWIKPDAFPVAAVSKAVSSLKKGSASDVIDAGYAFVILRVDDRQDAHVKSLDEVKAQIEPLIKQQKAAQAAQRKADQLLEASRTTNLEKAAAAQNLQVISTDFVTSKDGLPGIGNDPQFMATVFGQTANAPPDEAQIHAGFAVYEVTAVKPPATPTFEEIRSRVEQEFKNERAAQLLTQKTQELSDRAKAEKDLRKAAKELGAGFRTSNFVLPDGQVPDIGSMTGPASVAFSLKPGEISGPVDNGTTGAVLTVADRQNPTDQDYAAKKDQIRESLIQAKQNQAFGLFLENLRTTNEKAGKIKVNQAELQSLTKQPVSESE